MDYFKHQLELLKIERTADKQQFEMLMNNMSVQERRENGVSWYPVAIRNTEPGRGDYLTIELERTTHQDILHQFRFGITAALFSNHDAKEDRVEGIVTYVGANSIKLSLRIDELPDWTRRGKLGLDLVFDDNSYAEMETALKQASGLMEKSALIKILTGIKKPEFDTANLSFEKATALNEKQQQAINKIVSAQQIAIVHGPPGTGKTTTLVAAIKTLIEENKKQILVTAPSNAAVDLLCEKLAAQGLNVVRIGNPARVSEKQLELTLDYKMAAHSSNKQIKQLKRRAAEYRDMAHKYKRSFGAAEREQRKALFAEASSIMKEVEKTEQYITDDILAKAQVVAATLVGAAHYSIRQRLFEIAVIDEAAQGLEPACWIPGLKANKIIMAGDHCQLPPTIKSREAAENGFEQTLMEKAVGLHPEAVVLLEQQYRMHHDIMEFSSGKFYGGALVADATVAKALLFEDDIPLMFIDTAGCGFEERTEGKSISNPEEAAFLVKQLTHYLHSVQQKNIQSLPSVAVISPYRHQVELLKEFVHSNAELKKFTDTITVNTIDSFQGQEKDIVYISLTRSNADNKIGFLSEVRRMNVAMTRAKKKLVVMGDSATLSQYEFYADFIRYAENKNGYSSAWEWME